MRFDRASGAFTLEFEPSLAADTEVYLNEELYYPHGCRQASGKSQAVWTFDELRYDLHLDHPECFRVTRATNRVTLGDAGCRGKQVAVVVYSGVRKKRCRIASAARFRDNGKPCLGTMQ